MNSNNNLRPLYLLQFLYENTDEEYPVTTGEIIDYFVDKGFNIHRQTISNDIELLTEFGFDIITVRSRQNMYFYGTRLLDLAELKMIVDAIQAAKFITPKKSKTLIKKLTALASKKQSHRLNRKLHFADRPKSSNENILYTMDLLYDAISEEKKVKFKYIEYTPDKNKTLKHKGFAYEFSPYDLVWHNDSYYVFGYSEKHEKVIKFRVDRIYKPQKLIEEARAIPTDYDLPSYIKRTFSLFDDEVHTVELRCENDLMNAVIDHFGENVVVRYYDATHFIATVEISASPTFYAWVFTFNGKIRILSPKVVVDEFKQQLSETLKSQ